MVFSIVDKQFKGDLQMLSFNELAAGLGAEYPVLTFYLGAPTSPRSPGAHCAMSQLPPSRPRGCRAECNYMSWSPASTALPIAKTTVGVFNYQHGSGPLAFPAPLFPGQSRCPSRHSSALTLGPSVGAASSKCMGAANPFLSWVRNPCHPKALRLGAAGWRWAPMPGVRQRGKKVLMEIKPQSCVD